MTRSARGSAILIAFGAACADGPVEPPGPGAVDTAVLCRDAPATRVPDPVPARLSAGGGPWGVDRPLVVPELTVEAGAVVCVAADAVVHAGRLTVAGTADRPVRFAATTDTAWGGLSAGHAVVRHARIEHARTGLDADTLDLEDVHFRQIAGTAFRAGGAGRAVRVRVDTAVTGGDGDTPAAIVAGFANTLEGESADGELRLSDVAVRGSGGHGIRAVATVVLDGVRLDDVAGSAVDVRHWWKGGVYGGVRMEGGVGVGEVGDYVVDGWGTPVSEFMAAFADSIRPGQRVRSWEAAPRVRVVAGSSWEVERFGDIGDVCPHLGDVRVEAGGVLHAGCFRADSLRLVGAPGEPARLAAAPGVGSRPTSGPWSSPTRGWRRSGWPRARVPGSRISTPTAARSAWRPARASKARP